MNLSVSPVLTGELNVEICAGGTYDFNGTILDQMGVYTYNTTNSEGCDSIVTLNLSIAPVLTETIFAEICLGGSYNFNGDILNTAGTYTYNTSNASGCDSIVTLSLTVNPILTNTINASICQGGTYEFDGQSISAAGTYSAEFTTPSGCDSLVILNLTVNPPLSSTVNATICQGGWYEFFGQTITTAGTYSHDLTTPAGCDSIVYLVLQVDAILTSAKDQEICLGASFDFYGQILTQAGTYSHLLTTAQGCDSLITLTLTVIPYLEETINVEICTGSEYDFNGQIITNPGTYTATIASVEGCDSIVTLILTTTPTLTEQVEVEICQGGTYNFHGQIVSS
ncbi:MAG: hypothetical protein IPI60_06195 [Saprospiraceae bacterium]|nr:hypothetical protein [Saprospiraceae bacterium]